MRSHGFALLCLCVLLTACATNPMTGRSQLMLVSEKSVIAQSKLAYNNLVSGLEKNSKVNANPIVVGRVQTITDKLVAQAIRYRPDSEQWEWSVKVIDDPDTINAFCMPGGKMAIYTGLIDKLKTTDDEIAQVMGHEIGHALANHGAEKMSVGMASGIVMTALGSSRQNRGQQDMAQFAALVAWQLPNSREAESEADKIGIELAARAGYNPDAAVSLWKKMMEATGQQSRFDLLSTHPASPKRMDDLAELVPYMRPLYASTETRPSVPVRVDDGKGKESDEPVVFGGSSLVSTGKDKPLKLVSPVFEKFKLGMAELGCEACVVQFQYKKSRLRELYDRKEWDTLAREVLETDYPQDMTYFYLGVSAEGLGLPAMARTYYSRAAELTQNSRTRCKGALLDDCAGLDVPQAAESALARLQQEWPD